MKKEEFMKELASHLKNMNNSEKDKFLTFYDELISDYVENGMSEEEAVNKIGNPKIIAKELLQNQDSTIITLPSTGNRLLNIILLLLGSPLWGSLLLVGILLLGSVYIVFWCIPFTTGISCIAFFLTAIISMIGSPFVMAKNLSVGIVQL